MALTITSIAFRNLRYTTGTRTAPYGNVGDDTEVVIDFSYTGTLGAVDFFCNWIPNSEPLYADSTNPVLTISRFRNVQSGGVTSFRGGVGVLNPVNPKHGQIGTFSLANLGGNNYQLTGTVQITPYIRPQDTDASDNLLTPPWYNGLESLKFLWRLDIRTAATDTIAAHSTNTIDLSSYILPGNIGFFGEQFNGLLPDYTASPELTWVGALVALDTSSDSQATFTISNSAGNFTTSHRVELHVIEIISGFMQTQTFNENQKYERLTTTVGTAPVNGTRLKGFSVSGAGTSTATVLFTIAAGQITSRFAVWATVWAGQTDTALANHNNTLPYIQEPIAQTASIDVRLSSYPGSSLGENFNFSYHYADDFGWDYVFNHIKSYVEDRILVRWRISILNPSIQAIRFEWGIKRRTTGEILNNEQVSLFAADVPQSGSRDFRLKIGDIMRDFSITRTGDDYDFVYPTQIWKENWVPFPDVVFYALCEATQNGSPILKEWQSPDFELQTYDLTKNDASQPQALRKPPSIEFFDAVTLLPVAGILRNGKTLVVATFEDNNLNDLQRNESDLCGYLSINIQGDNQTLWEEFHNIREARAGSPWEKVVGMPTDNSKITKIDIKTAKIEGILDWAKLTAAFGGTFRVGTVTARLDSIEANIFHFRRYLLHIRGTSTPISAGNFYPFISFTSRLTNFDAIDVLNATSAINYKHRDDGADFATKPLLTKQQLLLAISLGATTYDVQVVPTIAPGYDEATVIIQHLVGGAGATSSWSYNFAGVVSKDTVVGINKKITVSSITGAHANTRFRIRTNKNVNFNTITPITAAGFITAINAIAVDTDLEFQIIDYENSNITISYTYA